MKAFDCLAVFFTLIATNAFSSTVDVAFKKSLSYLNAEKVIEESTAISERDLANIVVFKKEMGVVLTTTAGSNKAFDDKSIARGIGNAIIRAIPTYKFSSKRSLKRNSKNGEGFLDYISWNVKRFDENRYVFVSVQVSVASSVDTFVYAFGHLGDKWVSVFENEDPSALNSDSGRCSYQIGSFGDGELRFFLLVNTYASITSSIGQVSYSVYGLDKADNKLKVIFGPEAKPAVMPDPEKPFTVETNNNVANIKFIGARDTNANNIWTEVELKEVGGKIKQTINIKK